MRVTGHLVRYGLNNANIVTVVRLYLKSYVAPGVVQLICLPRRKCAVMERAGWWRNLLLPKRMSLLLISMFILKMKITTN
ncbi:Uncharacterised protein [Enterobacter cloacae]|nr:Uncharacterised protein [Enterobacter cloacae]